MSPDARISRLRAGLIHTIKTLQTKTQIILRTIRPTLGQVQQTLLVHIVKPVLHGLDVFSDARQWQLAAVAVRNHRADVVRFEERSVRPYLGLLVIAFFVLVGNQANQRAQAASTSQPILTADIQPQAIQGVLTAIDPLTPEINEQPAEVASEFIATDQLYLTHPTIADMNQAAQLSKKDPIPYTIKKGDTLVSIAQSFGRSVSTILEANNIQPADAGKITVGSQLSIPQEDTSDSLAWLAAETQAEQAAAAAAHRAQLLVSASVPRALAAAPDPTTKQVAPSDFNGGGVAAATIHSFIIPINYIVIARGVGGGHMGIDYDAPTGTAVHAAAAGKVIEITHGWAGGFGNSVLVDHGNGLTTRYAHLSQPQVSIGEIVTQGQQIALSGDTGNSTGPHLHFETRLNGAVINPYWLHR